MKKTLLVAIIALIITTGLVSLVNAQTNKNPNQSNRPELTEEMKTKMEARRTEMEAQREKMQNIMENGTYEKWRAEVKSRPKITDYINADNFAQFQEAHKLKQAGDFEGAEEIMEELGIDEKFGMMKKRGMLKGQGPRGMRKTDRDGECFQ